MLLSGIAVKLNDRCSWDCVNPNNVFDFLKITSSSIN